MYIYILYLSIYLSLSLSLYIYIYIYTTLRGLLRVLEVVLRLGDLDLELFIQAVVCVPS